MKQDLREYQIKGKGLLNFSKKVYQYFFMGMILGGVFPIISWFVEIFYRDISFSIIGIWKMHTFNPLLFVIDMAPFVLGGIAFVFGKIVDKNETTLIRENKERETYLEKISLFTDEITKGNYRNEIEIGDDTSGVMVKLVAMRENLRVSTDKELNRHWKITGRDIVSSTLRKYNKLEDLAYYTLLEIVKYSGLIQASFYLFDKEENTLNNIASYAYDRKKFIKQTIPMGVGLIGQTAYEKQYVYRKEIPDDYVSISSGILGDKKPGALLLVPLISDNQLQGVIEFASVENEMPERVIQFITSLSDVIGQTIFNIQINEKTERLLKESREMTSELQENEEELRQSAEEMMATQEELKDTNKTLADKVREVENSQNKLNALLENASEVITIIDKEGIVQYESPSTINILGYSSEEKVGTYIFDGLGDNKERLEDLFEKVKKNPLIRESIEFQYNRNGDAVWFEVIAVNLLNNEAIKGFILNTTDITQRKIAEDEQRERAKMQALSENSNDIIIRIGSDSKTLLYVNPSFTKYTSVEIIDALNKDIKDVSLPTGLQSFFDRVVNETKKNFINTESEFVLETKTMGDRIMQISSIPEFGDAKRLETILFVVHDITEQKQTELEIKNKNKKITESINYAKRIQNAILPDDNALQMYFKNSFIFYKPKDVVSGDFPWLFKKGDNVYVAAVDCTGHGVPGALLSVIGYFLLQNIVDHDRELTAAQVCDRLHKGVQKTLRQDQDGANSRDGMDIALCKYNEKENRLEYAGAHRPLYLLRNNEIEIFKGDRKAIGGIPYKKKIEKDFTNYIIDIRKNDKIFFFSDGLPDQLSEETKKKYQAKRIRELIMTNSSLNMSEYSKQFIQDFKQYKGNHKQIDDILLMGIGF